MRMFAPLIFGAIAAFSMLSGPAHAAKSWNLPNEELASFVATPVDIACELSGDCPPNCGEGSRQIGLLDMDGKLVPVLKNLNIFAGAALDLYPMCGRQIEVDGLFTWTDAAPTLKVYLIQRWREVGAEKWQRANAFTPWWGEQQGVDHTAKENRPWFRHDPTIKRIIEKDGFLGLGEAADQKYLEEN